VSVFIETEMPLTNTLGEPGPAMDVSSPPIGSPTLATDGISTPDKRG
jgi:hypothetical protein